MSMKHRGRVLVVDDEVEFMRALCDGLAEKGYQVTGTSDPAAALAGLRPGSFDVVLVDLHMPGLDGIPLLRSAREIDPALVAIVITGGASAESLEAATDAGAVDYLPKPFKLAALLPVLEQAIVRRRPRQLDTA
jgi:DNA-binding NtrC family response regulator